MDGETLLQKAEKFWNEIKDIKITDFCKEKTTEQVFEDILNHEKQHNEIDLKKAVEGTKEEKQDALKKLQKTLNGIKEKMNETEINKAKALGLLDDSGSVKIYDLFGLNEAKDPLAPTVGRVLLSLNEAETPLAPIPSDAAPYPVWGWKKSTAKTFQDAKGDRIKALICNLIRGFQVMNQSTERYVVKLFMDLGIMGFSMQGILATCRMIRALGALTEATEAYAVFSGILEVGINLIKLAVSVVVLAVLVPLMILMAKDAAGIMVIINDTKEDLRLVDTHITHGKIIAIFKNDAALDNPKPIIPKRLEPIIDPKSKKEILEGVIQAGFFAARKKDNALVGSQGSIKFDHTSSYSKGLFLGWEVPLSIGQNRVLVSADFAGSVSDFSDKTNDHGSQESTSTSSQHAKVIGRVNSGSGSEAYYVINVTEPGAE